MSTALNVTWLVARDLPRVAPEVLRTLCELAPGLEPTSLGIGERFDTPCDSLARFEQFWSYSAFRWRGTRGEGSMRRGGMFHSTVTINSLDVQSGRWSDLAMELGPLLGADIAVVQAYDSAGEFYFTFRDITDGLTELYWGTWFGRPYIDLIGRETFEALSKAQVRWTRPAGAFVQLTESSADPIERPLVVEDARRTTKAELGLQLFRGAADPVKASSIPVFDLPPRLSPEEMRRRLVELAAEQKASKVESPRAPHDDGRRTKVRARTADPRRAWATDCVRYFRELGFFASFRSDDDILGPIVEEWGKLPSPDDHPDLLYYADLSVLRMDEDRVWWEDTEAGVMAENAVYATDVIPRWARICRGIAEVTKIEEHWPESNEKLLRITFELNGKPVELQAEILDDYIDMRILAAFDEALGARPARLHLVETDDQSAFVVALRPEEADRLVRERGWRFSFP